ncbi:MAG TPA: NAD(P)/FAD-dependent oxidoreductase [Devosiaceae bacterium]|nr:NAD(P)/FAD-dependent oxidoreductase [Devosiaceae bacterium]
MPELLTPDICVIGGGAGGLAVATRARAYGATVVLIEKGKPGGEPTSSGALAAAALAGAARRANNMRTAAAFGIANDEPKINARGVFEHVRGILDATAPETATERLTALGVEVIAAEGRFADRQTVVAGGQLIQARRFVIATGGRPHVPEIEGLAGVPFFTSVSILDNPRKLTHLVVVGAGPEGLALAQAYRRLGSEVTVVEGATPLAESDPELGEIALRRLAEEGVVVRSSTRVVRVQQRSLGIGVTIRSGEAEEVLDASHILIASGSLPELDGLDLDKAGIRRKKGDPSRLELQGNLKTTNARVYAIGDAGGGLRHAHVARYQAELVVENIVLGLPVRNNPLRVPAIVFTDPEIAEIGLAEPEARRRHGKNYQVLRYSLAENHRARAERQGYGLVKLVADRRGRLLGAGIVGANAAEMIALFGFAIGNRMSVDNFRNLVAPYPTLAEIAHDIADEAVRSKAASRLHAWLMALRHLLP